MSSLAGVMMLALITGASTQARARRPNAPWVGIMMEDDQRPGVLILKAFKGSPARKAGLKSGDRIIAVDGKLVSTPSQVIRIVSRNKVGATINVRYQRMGSQNTTGVTLTTRPSIEKLMESLLAGKMAPDFTVSLPQNAPSIRLSHLRGKVVLLKLWSLSCPACIRSISTLRMWHKRYASKGLVILAVAKDPLPRLRQAMKRLKINYIIGRNPKKASELYHTPLIPMFVLIDKRGKVRDVALGYGKSMKGMEKKIRTLLKQKAKPRGRKKSTRGSRAGEAGPPETPTSPRLIP
jgi:peroxiredoxin